MATRGFLIRFIDIGLIVLFGFLMISDIEAASRVELAGSAEDGEEVVEPDEDLAFIVVEIAADGAFVVSRRDPATPAPSDAGPSERPPTTDEEGPDAQGQEMLDASPVTRATSVAALEAVVSDLADVHRSEGLQTVVLIEPHPASQVQRTVDVMDVADRLGLQKSLQMDIEIASAPDPGDPDARAPSDSADAGAGDEGVADPGGTR